MYPWKNQGELNMLSAGPRYKRIKYVVYRTTSQENEISCLQNHVARELTMLSTDPRRKRIKISCLQNHVVRELNELSAQPRRKRV